jgi:HNH endonuclease
VAAIDELVPREEQQVWIDGPKREGVEGLIPNSRLTDDRYDDRLASLWASREWPTFQRFLRLYLENCILRPFETQPSADRKGWWYITISDSPHPSGLEGAGGRAKVTIWQQFALTLDFRFGEDASLRAFGEIWLDKATMQESGLALPHRMEVGLTELVGNGREQSRLKLQGVGEDELRELFGSEGFIRSARVSNLNLMRKGYLTSDRHQYHMPKLLESVFAEGSSSEPWSAYFERTFADAVDPELQTLFEALVWRRANVRRFVDPVLRRADGRCQLSGVSARELVEACHIKGFAASSPAERLDLNNGLCLSVHVHRAFDRHLIGIRPDGAVLYADALSLDDRARMNLPTAGQLNVGDGQRAYLAERYAQFLERNPAMRNSETPDIVSQ